MHDRSREAVLQPVFFAAMPDGSSLYDGDRAGKSERGNVAGAGGGVRWLKSQCAPAVFLDRDGTIAEEVGYLNHVSRFRLLPGVAAAIRQLNEAELPVIVVTNQSGVGPWIFSGVGGQRSSRADACGASCGGRDGSMACIIVRTCPRMNASAANRKPECSNKRRGSCSWT